MNISSAFQLLIDEHGIIKEGVKAVKRLDGLWEKDTGKFEAAMLDLIRFFRGYGDEFHHQKEEQELFGEMCRKNEMLGTGIIAEMEEQHEGFRDILRQSKRSTNAGEYSEAYSLMFHYTEDLLDHIAVEDDELFPMAEGLFSDEEKEKLYFRFSDIDRELGEGTKQELANIVETTTGRLENV